MNNISVVIPTHYRHVFLSRVLDYYKNSKFKIYVADSSKDIFKDRTKYENITYLHFPEDLYFRKMQKSFSYVNTKYSFICADDDFVSIESVKKCALYLEENQDYSSAQGHYVAFNPASSLIPYPKYLNLLNLNICEDNPVDRLNNQLANYVFHYYAVHRTSFLKYFFEEINPKFSNTSANVTELANTMLSIINGKHRSLPIFYAARDDAAGIPDNMRKEKHFQIEEIQKSDPDFFEKFVIIVSNFFSKKHSIPIDEARLKLEKVLEKYFEKQKMPQQIRKLSKPSLPKKILNNILPTFLVERLKNQIYKKKTNGIKGFPFSDKESKKQWQEMKNVICRHDIDYSKIMKKYLESWHY